MISSCYELEQHSASTVSFERVKSLFPALQLLMTNTILVGGDVTIENPDFPQLLAILLKTSKKDQFGKGVNVFISRTNTPVCAAVTAVLAYMASRGTSAGLFFIYKNGHPLTKSKFNHEIKKALQEIGLPYERFSGHSVRIGAATTAAKVEIEDSVIQMMGRWSSSAFLLYVCTLRE